MSLGVLLFMKGVAMFSVHLAAGLFFALIVWGIGSRFFRSWRPAFFKYHPRVAWLFLIFMSLHVVILAPYLVVRGRLSFPVFGILSTIVSFVLVLSGLLLWMKLKDAKVPLKSKNRYRYFHYFCILLLVVVVSTHVYEIKHPIFKYIEEYVKIPRV